MTIYIHYHNKSNVTLHNVDKVIDAGPRMVKVAMQFSDPVITHDHVKRIVIEPDSE